MEASFHSKKYRLRIPIRRRRMTTPDREFRFRGSKPGCESSEKFHRFLNEHPSCMEMNREGSCCQLKGPLQWNVTCVQSFCLMMQFITSDGCCFRIGGNQEPRRFVMRRVNETSPSYWVFTKTWSTPGASRMSRNHETKFSSTSSMTNERREGR